MNDLNVTQRVRTMLRKQTGMEPEPTFEFLDLAWRLIMFQYVYAFDWTRTDVIRSPVERDPGHFMEHQQSMVADFLMAFENNRTGEDLIKGDCEDTAYTLGDFASFAGVPPEDIRIHRVAALPETAVLDHALMEIRIGEEQLCYDIYTKAPHRPYDRKSPRAPRHRWVDWQPYPIRPRNWRKTV